MLQIKRVNALSISANQLDLFLNSIAKDQMIFLSVYNRFFDKKDLDIYQDPKVSEVKI